MSDTTRLLEAEKDLLLEKIGRIDLMLTEGAWTGSHGGHDPDFMKLRGGLKRFWIEKAAKDPHPFTYCVRHLRKHVANPERLCAWLKDQALGTTKWRKGNRKIGEAGEMLEWQPTVEELREALLAYEDAARDLGIIVEGDDAGAGEGTPPDAGGSDGDTPPAGGDAGAEGAEAGAEGSAPSSGEDGAAEAHSSGEEGAE